MTLHELAFLQKLLMDPQIHNLQPLTNTINLLKPREHNRPNIRPLYGVDKKVQQQVIVRNILFSFKWINKVIAQIQQRVESIFGEVNVLVLRKVDQVWQDDSK